MDRFNYRSKGVGYFVDPPLENAKVNCAKLLKAVTGHSQGQKINGERYPEVGKNAREVSSPGVQPEQHVG